MANAFLSFRAKREILLRLYSRKLYSATNVILRNRATKNLLKVTGCNSKQKQILRHRLIYESFVKVAV